MWLLSWGVLWSCHAGYQVSWPPTFMSCTESTCECMLLTVLTLAFYIDKWKSIVQDLPFVNISTSDSIGCLLMSLRMADPDLGFGGDEPHMSGLWRCWEYGCNECNGRHRSANWSMRCFANLFVSTCLMFGHWRQDASVGCNLRNRFSRQHASGICETINGHWSFGPSCWLIAYC